MIPMTEPPGKMKRRAFLGSLGAASVGAAWMPAVAAGTETRKRKSVTSENVRLAGMSLTDLRQSFHDELFKVQLPFWDEHGIDHQYGGIMCSLDYDGTLANTDKLMWFQGRAIWVYSFIYNHFG